MFASTVGFSTELRFLRQRPSYMHFCRALTLALAKLSCELGSSLNMCQSLMTIDRATSEIRHWRKKNQRQQWNRRACAHQHSWCVALMMMMISIIIAIIDAISLLFRGYLYYNASSITMETTSAARLADRDYRATSGDKSNQTCDDISLAISWSGWQMISWTDASQCHVIYRCYSSSGVTRQRYHQQQQPIVALGRCYIVLHYNLLKSVHGTPKVA